ncbi:MAG: thiamine pyrophosphate-dependent enzyme, partial [Candidatus Promineifilaceae bacterium]|nr:thiamine pyrophosphate-dependent enzyme [Candidatus Promineifilaceae bacterium]
GGARRPLIVAGLGLEPQKPYGALLDLAEALQAPVIVTPKAKGAFPADHPLAAGTFGLTGYDPPYELADEADCIVAVGFDVVEMESLWDQPQPMIWIAPWANEEPRLTTVEFELVGPLAPILERLAVFAAANYEPASGWGEARVKTHRERKALNANRLPEAAPGRMRPQTVFDVLRRNVARDAIVTTDTGSHKIAMALMWPAYVPNTYLLSNGLSSMGYGLPAAIAAARMTERTTLCVTGDGGLAMALGELGLLAELDLPVIVVVMNDNALDLIRSGQRRRGKPVFGTEFENPDYEAIAHGFGLVFYRVTDEETCAGALRAATAGEGPTLIEAMIDPSSYPTTPR